MHETNEPVMERISNYSIDGWTRLGSAERSMEKSFQRKAGKVPEVGFFSHTSSSTVKNPQQQQTNAETGVTSASTRQRGGGLCSAPALALQRREVQPHREARACCRQPLPALGDESGTGRNPTGADPLSPL